MVLVGVLGGRPHGATQAGQHLDGLMSGAAGKEGVFAVSVVEALLVLVVERE
ncbi:unnamed protein product, partial [Tilletia controversa]